MATLALHASQLIALTRPEDATKGVTQTQSTKKLLENNVRRSKPVRYAAAAMTVKDTIASLHDVQNSLQQVADHLSNGTLAKSGLLESAVANGIINHYNGILAKMYPANKNSPNYIRNALEVKSFGSLTSLVPEIVYKGLEPKMLMEEYSDIAFKGYAVSELRSGKKVVFLNDGFNLNMHYQLETALRRNPQSAAHCVESDHHIYIRLLENITPIEMEMAIHLCKVENTILYRTKN